jgi:hypothetical protein
MIQKIKRWWHQRKFNKHITKAVKNETYTREQMEKVYYLGYNDGKRDGLAIAREQATKSLKEILWQQNQSSQK